MATLDEQRAQAKADGYTDAEIDQFLAGQAASGPQTPNQNPLIPSPVSIGTGAVVAGGALLAGKAAQNTPTLARMALRRIPGVGEVMDAAELLKGRGAPAEATATGSVRARMAPRGSNVIPISRGRAGGPTRPITMEGKPTKAPANIPPNGPGVGRGKSGPKLAREAAYRENIKAVRPPAGSAAARAAATSAAEPDLMAQLQASIEAEPQMRAIGANAAERQAIRSGSGLSEIGGGLAAFAPQAVEMLLSADPQYHQMKAEQQLVNDAQDFYGRHTWNAAKTPEQQRTLVLEYAKKFHPELMVRPIQQPQGF